VVLLIFYNINNGDYIITIGRRFGTNKYSLCMILLRVCPFRAFLEPRAQRIISGDVLFQLEREKDTVPLSEASCIQEDEEGGRRVSRAFFVSSTDRTRAEGDAERKQPVWIREGGSEGERAGCCGRDVSTIAEGRDLISRPRP